MIAISVNFKGALTSFSSSDSI